MSPVLLDPLGERVHLLLEMLAGRLQLAQLRLGLHQGVVLGPLGPLLGVGQQTLGLLLGAGQDPSRLLAGLLDRQVGGALGQHQRPAQGVVGAARLGRRLLGPLRALEGLAQAVLEHLHAGGHPLEELVDILGVIAAHLLAELDLPQRLGRDVHAAIVVRPPSRTRDTACSGPQIRQRQEQDRPDLENEQGDEE